MDQLATAQMIQAEEGNVNTKAVEPLEDALSKKVSEMLSKHT